MDYRSSGVDIDAGNEVVRRIQRARAEHASPPGVLSDIGSFGGLFSLNAAGRRRSGAGGERRRRRHEAEGGVHDERARHDRAGSRQSLRQRHPRAGRASAVLSRLSRDRRLSPDVAASIVEGIARACRANGCALLGGETAEMPGFYQPTANTTSPASSSASSKRARVIDGRRIARRRRADRPALVRPAHQRLFARAADRVRSRLMLGVDARPRARRDGRRSAAARRIDRICASCSRCSTRAW